jgi:hypothetical protein
LFIFYVYYLVFSGLLYQFLHIRLTIDDIFYCWSLCFTLGFVFVFSLMHKSTFIFRVSINMSFFKLCLHFMYIINTLGVYCINFYLFCCLYMTFYYCWGLFFNLGFAFLFGLMHISTSRFRVSINMSFFKLCLYFMYII